MSSSYESSIQNEIAIIRHAKIYIKGKIEKKCDDFLYKLVKSALFMNLEIGTIIIPLLPSIKQDGSNELINDLSACLYSRSVFNEACRLRGLKTSYRKQRVTKRRPVKLTFPFEEEHTLCNEFVVFLRITFI